MTKIGNNVNKNEDFMGIFLICSGAQLFQFYPLWRYLDNGLKVQSLGASDSLKNKWHKHTGQSSTAIVRQLFSSQSVTPQWRNNGEHLL